MRQAAGAEDRGGILHVGRDAVERVGDEHEDEGKGIAGVDEDEPLDRVDVDEMHEGRQVVERSDTRR